jgi:hypothetical protein
VHRARHVPDMAAWNLSHDSFMLWNAFAFFPPLRQQVQRSHDWKRQWRQPPYRYRANKRKKKRSSNKQLPDFSLEKKALSSTAGISSAQQRSNGASGGCSESEQSLHVFFNGSDSSAPLKASFRKSWRRDSTASLSFLAKC